MSQLRQTRQRRVILEQLQLLGTHPTADALFNAVRAKLPRISLATVYRNLEILSGQGLIRKIDVGGPPSRFDADLSPHYHVRCIDCNRVDDLKHQRVEVQDLSDDGASGYDLMGYRLEFYGLCPRCRLKKQGVDAAPEHFSLAAQGGTHVSIERDEDRA